MTADKAYGSGLFLAWLERHRVEAHIPLIDRGAQTPGRLPRSAFHYDAEQDAYVCPQGKLVQRMDGNAARMRTMGTIGYRTRVSDCGPCPLRSDCTNGPSRVMSRSVGEAVRNRVRMRPHTEAFARSLCLGLRIEHLFAAIKHNDDSRRLRLRGLRGAGGQWLQRATSSGRWQARRQLLRPNPDRGQREPVPKQRSRHEGAIDPNAANERVTALVDPATPLQQRSSTAHVVFRPNRSGTV